MVWPVSFYQCSSGLCTTHAASSSLPFNPPPPPPPFSRSRRITDVSSFALRPSHRVSFESGTPFLQNSIVCRPAWGCLRGLSLREPPFFVLFSSPQRGIISMTVTREEGEIKQNGPFKKYYFIMDGREEKRFRIQKLHCRGRVRQVCGCENSAGFSVTMTLCLLFVHFSPDGANFIV